MFLLAGCLLWILIEFQPIQPVFMGSLYASCFVLWVLLYLSIANTFWLLRRWMNYWNRIWNRTAWPYSRFRFLSIFINFITTQFNASCCCLEQQRKDASRCLFHVAIADYGVLLVLSRSFPIFIENITNVASKGEPDWIDLMLIIFFIRIRS